MSVLQAITRAVSPSIGRCELTHIARASINFDLACLQHQRYVQCLKSLGCETHCLPAQPELPDSVFVEDTCVVLDELAVMTRPGAESRRPEISAVAVAIKQFRELCFIQPPGTLDGGDVLRIGRRLFAGRSTRTNDAGIDQLRQFTSPCGYTVTTVPIAGCLHLKSAVSTVGENTVLANRPWVKTEAIGDVQLIDVDPNEPMAANALLVGQGVIFPAEFPATRRRLEAAGVHVVAVEMSELAKAEGGVTCCSLVFASRPD
jgi:dimethylargininase